MNRILFFLLVCCLSSCAANTSRNSFVGGLPNDPAVVGQIAQDAAMRLSVLYPPGQTRIKLMYPDKKGQSKVPDKFSTALENSLRKKGFTISPAATLQLDWTINALVEINEKKEPNKSYYLYLHLTDVSSSAKNRAITRLYNDKGDPQAGFAEQQP